MDHPIPPPPTVPQGPAAALPPPPPPAPTSRAARRWPRAVAVAVCGSLAVGIAGVVTGAFDRGPSHPEQWDPRVLELAGFVEDERGLEFDHPVHVDFLSAEEYSAQTTTDEAGIADDERLELDRYAAELRAFGLASGDIDLVEAYNAVSDSGTLAFYDPDDERVRVRGTEMTAGLQVTLVHELTHALQDQHFDLGELYDDDLDSSEQTAFLGLIEGDALRIESGYAATGLSAEEQAAYEEEYARELEQSQEATAEVPSFVSASFAVPYALGQPFVVMLANQGGNDAVDAAFDDPPSTEEHLFDPASYLAKEDGIRLDINLHDVEVLDEGPFGAPSWYLLLAERIDPIDAFEAALGWDGDRYATFERDGRSCVRAAFAGDTADDERQMAAALRAWADAMPRGAAKQMELDGQPALESCDPGSEVDDPNLSGRSTDALFVPSLWGYLIADASSELDADSARCYADRVIDGLSYEEITDPDGAALAEPGFRDSMVAAYDACG